MIYCIDVNNKERLDCISIAKNFVDWEDQIASDRYSDAFNYEVLSLIVLVNNGSPIGYCSYFVEVREDIYDPEKKYINYLIDYVFIKEKYRGYKYSNLLLEHIKNCVSGNLAKDINYFLNSSDYASKEGNLFGLKIDFHLKNKGLMCFCNDN